MTPSQHLIEYRDAAGNLLLPQYGGCWHDYQWFRCHKHRCAKCNKDAQYISYKDLLYKDNPNLATPQGFFDLWEAMKAREDFEHFTFRIVGDKVPTGCISKLAVQGYGHNMLVKLINPDTFPETVVNYLKEREGK